MLAIDLKPELEKQLADWARRNGQSIDTLIGEAVERLLEDLHDIEAADAAMRDYDSSKNVTLAELKRKPWLGRLSSPHPPKSSSTN